MAYFSFAATEIHDIENLPFSATDYSKFKFGDSHVAEQFGRELARKFIEKYQHLLHEHEEIIVLPSPYNAIPTASNQMTLFFRKEINHHLLKLGKNAVMDSKIHRYKTYSTDYGNLDFEQRKQLISTDRYHLSRSFLENRLCLFLDDVKITGSHEYVIRKQIIDNQLDGKGVFGFLYFAELKNAQIAPQFENILNYAYVKGIKEVVEVMQNPNFVFNTRIIKYILISPAENFDYFIKNIAQTTINELLDWAIANNYHQMPEYKANLDKIIT